MLNKENKKALMLQRRETIHQWCLRIAPYFGGMTDPERVNTLYNIAEEAFKAGMRERFNQYNRKNNKAGSAEEKESVRAFMAPVVADKLDISITHTGLSRRATNVLSSAGIITLGDLVQHSGKELLRLPRAGFSCLYEVEEMLKTYGLTLK